MLAVWIFSRCAALSVRWLVSVLDGEPTSAALKGITAVRFALSNTAPRRKSASFKTENLHAQPHRRSGDFAMTFICDCQRAFKLPAINRFWTPKLGNQEVRPRPKRRAVESFDSP